MAIPLLNGALCLGSQLQLVIRAVVNGLYFLMKLFALPFFQSSQVMCTLLPCLMAPLSRILKSDVSRELPSVCKLPVYALILQICEQTPDLIPEPPVNCNQADITGTVRLRYPSPNTTV